MHMVRWQRKKKKNVRGTRESEPTARTRKSRPCGITKWGLQKGRGKNREETGEARAEDDSRRGETKKKTKPKKKKKKKEKERREKKKEKKKTDQTKKKKKKKKKKKTNKKKKKKQEGGGGWRIVLSNPGGKKRGSLKNVTAEGGLQGVRELRQLLRPWRSEARLTVT